MHLSRDEKLSSSESASPLNPEEEEDVALVRPVCALRLDYEISGASIGRSVVLGAYYGCPAVIKLLGPDSCGLRAWRAEVEMYGRLKALQGELVPQLLGSGHLNSGVHFIALGKVVGKTISALHGRIPPGAAESARQGLIRFREIVPGFLHGDIRPNNIMWGACSAERAGNPSCVFIDFGMSRIDASTVDQGQEELSLCQLFDPRPS